MEERGTKEPRVSDGGGGRWRGVRPRRGAAPGESTAALTSTRAGVRSCGRAACGRAAVRRAFERLTSSPPRSCHPVSRPSHWRAWSRETIQWGGLGGSAPRCSSFTTGSHRKLCRADAFAASPTAAAATIGSEVRVGSRAAEGGGVRGGVPDEPTAHRAATVGGLHASAPAAVATRSSALVIIKEGCDENGSSTPRFALFV
jgi:hypothetical protein